MRIKTVLIVDIRNKLQTSSLIIERLAKGKPIPKDLIKLAKSNLEEVEKILSTLKK